MDSVDCGPACLKIVAAHYGKHYSLDTLRNKSFLGRQGVSIYGISLAAEAIGFRTVSAKVSTKQLIEELPTPFIAHWRQKHFVVVYKVTKNKVYVSDPAIGRITYSIKEFENGWISSVSHNEGFGVVLLLQTTPAFYDQSERSNTKGFVGGWKYVIKHLKPHRRLTYQMLLGILFIGLVQLIFPFLTRAIVDIGIQENSLNLINLILIGQLMLFASQVGVDYIISWISLHLGAKINISLVANFLMKLMKLPLSFFDSRIVGDLMERIEDHKRVEDFLTGSSLHILLSSFTIVVFSIVLILFDIRVFGIFFVSGIIYISWILIFLEKRKVLDYKHFDVRTNNQNNILQLLYGVHEIKLNNAELKKRWDWEKIQAKLFKVNEQSLKVDQYSRKGSMFINEIKNILITYVSASLVFDGSISLGTMLAIQYIIGQLNGPLNQMINFIHSAQDAKISLSRLNEIHSAENENSSIENPIMDIPEKKSIRIQDLTFRYGDPKDKPAVNNINLLIPEGKVTAIVGPSGSGKTTLIKLLLKFYDLPKDNIFIGDEDFSRISSDVWRSSCGAVMQDGFIFSDSIANNISVSEQKEIDKEKLKKAVEIANIEEFIEELPLKYNTKLGSEGTGLSQGQRQRVLIARAVYKDPQFLFFDEATNALDANNELTIIKNLEHFFKGRTVIVVAHRLSTVKNADQIVVMDNGEIREIGTHNELTASKGFYYQLVKNQLELGN